MVLNNEMISVSSLSSESSDKKFSLCVITDALMPVFIRLTVEKSLSAVQLVMGRAARAHRRQFILGNMSLGLMSSTSTSDGKALSAVAFLFSCCTNTSCSASSTVMEKCVLAGCINVLSLKGFERGSHKLSQRGGAACNRAFTKYTAAQKI